MRDAIEEVVDNLDDYADERPGTATDDGDAGAAEKDVAPHSATVPVLGKEDLAPGWQIPFPVLCIASRSPLDQCACIMLAQLLKKHGVNAEAPQFSDVTSSRGLELDGRDVRLVCLSYFGQTSKPAHVRYLIRRLKRLMPKARFLAGFWLLEKDAAKVEGWRTAVGADYVATSLAEATALCVHEAMQPGAPIATSAVERRVARESRAEAAVPARQAVKA